ncbi:CGNR zinc finger domain-containing protein [Streptomyces sp. NPDC002454]
MVAAASAPSRGHTVLTLDLALTLRHDGRGGVADDLTVPTDLTAWVRQRSTVFATGLDAVRYTADPANLQEVRSLRSAVRALFARAVRPAPPSRADAHRLPTVPQALAVLNAAARRVPVVPVLAWPEGAAPALDAAPAARAVAGDLLITSLAGAAGAFLTGPDAERLRVCPGPRCVRYFLKEHPRQGWCTPSCGNRARVARHHERQRATP